MRLKTLLSGLLVFLMTPLTASGQEAIEVPNLAAAALWLNDLGPLYEVLGFDVQVYDEGTILRRDHVIAYQQTGRGLAPGPALIEIRLVTFNADPPRSAIESAIAEFLDGEQQLRITPISPPTGLESFRWFRFDDRSDPLVIGYGALFEMTDGLASVAGFGSETQLILDDVAHLAQIAGERLLA